MTVRIADLDKDWLGQPTLRVEPEAWARILACLRAKDLIDPQTLDRLASTTETITIPREQARKIARQMEDVVLREVMQPPEPPPTVPAYIVPIATSNGVWVDPALGPQEAWWERQKVAVMSLLEFAAFCDACQGFSIGTGEEKQ